MHLKFIFWLSRTEVTKNNATFLILFFNIIKLDFKNKLIAQIVLSLHSCQLPEPHIVITTQNTSFLLHTHTLLLILFMKMKDFAFVMLCRIKSTLKFSISYQAEF